MASNSPLQYPPSIGRLLMFANKAASRLSTRWLRKHDLTLMQWVVLSALWRRPGMSESELASYCRANPSSLNRLIDRMEASRLVVRGKDPEDGRRVLLGVGPEGKRKKALQKFYEDVNAVLLRGFSKEEAQQALDLLNRMVENVESELKDG